MQNSKRESTGNGTAPLAGGALSPSFADAAEAAGYLTGSGRAPPTSQAPPAENPAHKKARAGTPPCGRNLPGRYDYLRAWLREAFSISSRILLDLLIQPYHTSRHGGITSSVTISTISDQCGVPKNAHDRIRPTPPKKTTRQENTSMFTHLNFRAMNTKDRPTPT